MSTIFNIRNIRLPHVSRIALLSVAALLVLGLVGGIAGWKLHHRLTNNTVVAYFPQVLALYPGDRVQIMGVRVGTIDKIEPDGNKMRVTMHYQSRYKVPANATASILNPSLVASRTIQLAPAYTGGPVLDNGAVIPIERTQVPVEWDDLRNQVTDIISQLGPTQEQPEGVFGDVIASFADALDGNGKQLNTTLTALSDAITALNEGRGDFFAVIKSLALFVNALRQSDQQFVELNGNLAEFTDTFNRSDRELANTLQQVDGLLSTARKFVGDNGPVLAHDINNLAETTNAILQPEPRDGLETALHVFPNLAANLVNIYEPAHGALTAVPVVASFANPLQFICSSIQAGSRLGYQESAELCAQYLAPIMDAIKFNFPPFGANMLSTAATLPKMVAYSEERLRPPPGYKDTTVPGVFSRDTLFSHGNHEPGWVVAPGMQGLQVQAFTQNMLTPDSLAELMGGPDVTAVPPAGPRGGAVPNAYDESNPLPPPWYPQPGPPPGPAPGVVPGPLPVAQQLPGTNPAQQGPAPAGPVGPPLPAEVGGR